jgi:hypothetical protein
VQLNVLSVFVRLDEFEETARMYRKTIDEFARESIGFRGMMGMVNRDSGKFMSVGLHDTEAHLVAARDSETNQRQFIRYQHLFLSDVERTLLRVEVRYMPMNRPFPGQDVCFARVTNGWVPPKDVNKAIKLSRDSVVFGAISEKGCCGFFLCANHDTGQIMGFSMWDTMENLERSESDRGYYRREMAKHDHLRTGPYEREVFEVFARSGAEGHHSSI